MSGATRSARLLERQADRLQRSREVPFVTECTAGTIAPETFARYVMIEEAFVITAARVAGFMVYSHDEWDGIGRHATTLHSLMTKQRAYFAELRGRWPVDERATEVLDASRVLSDYVLDLVAAAGVPGATVAMFGAETLYQSWCARAVELGHEREPDLQAWLDLHVLDTFSAQVATLAGEIDAMDPRLVPDEQLDAWYVGMLDAEDAFHASLYL